MMAKEEDEKQIEEFDYYSNVNEAGFLSFLRDFGYGSLHKLSILNKQELLLNDHQSPEAFLLTYGYFVVYNYSSSCTYINFIAQTDQESMKDFNSPSKSEAQELRGGVFCLFLFFIHGILCVRACIV